ncbi:uncharacterized protein LOC109835337, partial [Asparagus officinalis]
MGFISRKILPACGNMCVCCPALRPSSRRPVKRYKKLLAEIFPRTLDGSPNERKINKLCEYAAKNPHRIPKIAKFLEQRSFKELRMENVNFIKIITAIYSKLLCICKEQMAYFAISLLDVIVELLNHQKHEAVQILGCQILTRFIYSQADITYSRNIECLVRKVCTLACENGVDHKRLLRAASLQCLSAMVWFMTEYSHIFTDFDEIIHATLQNYGTDEHIEDGGQRHETHHNWVDEVVRSEVRTIGNIGIDVSPSATTIIPRPDLKDASKLTREESETPEVWSHICVQKLAELAKESTTMRRVLDPMFIYFDNGGHWAARHGLAFHVLSEMSYLGKSSGNEQMILAAIIRHMDHKNVVHDPRIKSNIIQIATCLVRQLRSPAGIAEIAIVSDLCRHLRKSLQATIESAGPQDSNCNYTLQNSIEDCLLEIAKGICNAYPLFDMMSMTLEKLPASTIAARATIESLLILSHIVSLTSVSSHPQLVFPEGLLLQLVKTMMHPDIETRIGAHQIFSVILVRSETYLKLEYEYKKWQSKSTSAFASATALFEKLRREKECVNTDKLENYVDDDSSIKDTGDEEVKNGRIRKPSPCFRKLCSVIDRTDVSTSPDEHEANIITLTEDQIAMLLSALWLQANRSDNLPSDFEAIAHSFSLTILSSRLKNLNQCNTIRIFQLPLSLMNAALDPTGILHPSCRRSLFTLASSMLAFAGKNYHMADLTNTLKFLISSNADPYLRIGDDLQIYIRPQADIKNFGSEIDQQAAKSLLSDFQQMMVESGRYLLDIIIRDLSSLTNLEKDELAQKLSEMFIPEDGPLFGSINARDWGSFQALGTSEESLSLDEGSSRVSSVDGEIASESFGTDIPRFVSRIPTKPPLSPVISVGQLLESALHVAGQVAGTSISTSPLPYGAMASQCDALGMGMRRKLS